MTELQMGLIGLGAAAVAGVLGYNKWQEYRQRKLAESVFRPRHDDVLLAGGGGHAGVHDGAGAGDNAHERHEPPFAAVQEEHHGQRIEPVFADATSVGAAFDASCDAGEGRPMAADAFHAPSAAPAEPPRATFSEQPVVETRGSERPVAPRVREIAADDGDEAGEVPLELLDPRLEFVVAMELVEPVSSVQILASQRSALQRLGKPVHWVGYHERAHEWQRLVSDVDIPIRRLRVGLQLVNRLGPVSDGDLLGFTDAMQALADELMAVADMPPSRVADQAAEIDRFCAAVDLEIGLNLVSRGTPFPGTKIRALAEAAGMTLGADGLFTRYDDVGRAQFSLQNFEATRFAADNLRNLTTHGLTFLLDVPRVPHGERAFMQMSEVARRFADALRGVLVDDNRQPLSEAQLEHIRREFVGKPQATMARFGVPAGSPQALRLFS